MFENNTKEIIEGLQKDTWQHDNPTSTARECLKGAECKGTCEEWEDRYPLNTFPGETKKELVALIRVLIVAERFDAFTKGRAEEAKVCEGCRLQGKDFVENAIKEAKEEERERIVEIIKKNKRIIENTKHKAGQPFMDEGYIWACNDLLTALTPTK